MQHDIFVTCNKEVNKIAEKRVCVNSSDSKKQVRLFQRKKKRKKAFHVEVEKDTMEAFEKELAKQNKTKKEWLDQKINEELKK